MSARDQLIEIVYQNAVADRVKDGKDLALVPVVRKKVEEMADAILAAGFGLAADAGAKAWDECVNEADRQWQIGHASAAILKADNPYRATVNAIVSPDCRDGNCRKCDGVAWDEARDEPTACQCRDLTHGAIGDPHED